MSVRHVNIDQNLRLSLPLPFSAQHPREQNEPQCDCYEARLIAAGNRLFPRSGGDSSVPFTLRILPKWCLPILGPHCLSLHPISLEEGKGVQTSVSGI